VSIPNIIIAMYMVFMVLGTAATIKQVGQPREPFTNGGAVVVVFINVAVFIALLAVWPKLLA
jgi:hypothetical protein